MREKCEICHEKSPKYVLRFILGVSGLFYELDVCESCRWVLDLVGSRYVEVDRV